MRSPTSALLLSLVLLTPMFADDLAPQQRGGGRGPGNTGVYRDRVTPNWFAGDAKFWYRNALKGGAKEFILVDAEKGTRGPAFDHAKLAAGLTKASDTECKADKLPFDEIEFSDGGKAVLFDAAGKRWKCDLSTYACTDTGPAKKKEEPRRDGGVDPRSQAPAWEREGATLRVAAEGTGAERPDLAFPGGAWE